MKGQASSHPDGRWWQSCDAGGAWLGGALPMTAASPASRKKLSGRIWTLSLPASPALRRWDTFLLGFLPPTPALVVPQKYTLFHMQPQPIWGAQRFS